MNRSLSSTAPASLDRLLHRDWRLSPDGAFTEDDPIAPAGQTLATLLRHFQPGWERRLPGDFPAGRGQVILSGADHPDAEGFLLRWWSDARGPCIRISRTTELLAEESGASELFLTCYQGALYHQDRDLAITRFRPGSEEIALANAYAAHARRRQSFIEWIHEDDRAAFLTALGKADPRPGPFELEYRVYNYDQGGVLHLRDVRLSRNGHDFSAGYQGLLTDVSRQVVAEKRLAHRAWKETVSTVTAGLLHDFSNVMTGICSLGDLYASSVGPENPMHGGLQTIHKNAYQAQKLLRRIIEINREVSGERSYHYLQDLINDQLDLIRAILPKGTALETTFPEEKLAVRLDEVGFRRVLLNISTNARDAFGRQGRLTIEIRRGGSVRQHRPDLHPSPFFAPADMAEIILGDNGSGMPPAVLRRAFDPFFSTKDPNRGSGLGLYNMRLFAEEHRGRVAIASEQGHGTRLHLFLPLLDADPPVISTPATSSNDRTTTPVAPPADRRSRRRALVYSWEDPRHYDLVATLIDEGWEIMAINDPAQVIDNLDRPTIPFDALIIYRIGLDEQADPLLHFAHSNHPRIRRVLVIVGEAPDQVPQGLRQKADLILSPNLKLASMLRRLNRLFT